MRMSFRIGGHVMCVLDMRRCVNLWGGGGGGGGGARFEEIFQFHLRVLDLGRCISSVYSAC